MLNRKIIFSAVSILGAFSLLGGATFAFFSSSATNANNSFGAGTLTLLINGSGDSLSSPVFTVTNMAPGDISSPQSFILKNNGTVNASAVKVTGITVTPTPPTPNLGDKLILTLWDDSTADGVVDGGETVYGSAALTSAGWTNLTLSGVSLTGGSSKTITGVVTFDSSADDTYQGKAASFDISFAANQ